MSALSITLTDPQSAHVAMQGTVWPHIKAMTTAGHKLTLTIKRAEDIRTLQQNAFMWSVVLKEISQQASINNIGATMEGWHLYFKRAILGYKYVKTQLPGKKRPSVVKTLRSTRDLTVKKMSEYLEEMQATAVTDFGVMFSDKRWQDIVIDPDTGEIMRAE